MAKLQPRSLAGQAVGLMVAVVLVVVVVGGALAALDARKAGDEAARQRVIAIVSALAAAPSTAAAIQSGQPAAQLQSMTESIRRETDIAFITIMAPDRTRFTHPDPSQIGGQYLGTIEPALRGETFTEMFTGTLGPSVRAVAPVRGPDGTIVGLVSAGITRQTLADGWYAQLPLIGGIAVAVLGAAMLGTWVIRRRLMRQTGGLSPANLRVMYEHHDAVLHAVSEGLVVIEGDEAVLVNDEARRLLDLSAHVPIDARSLPGFLSDGEYAVKLDGAGRTGILKDEVHVTSDRVLVVNRSQVATKESRPASVVTIRDRTELQGALGELDSMRVFAESLRSAAHESANRLHTIVALVEMGRTAEAVQFATTQLELSQHLVDRLTAAVDEPALVALLLGKTAQAAERGVTLTVTEDTELAADPRGGLLTPTELVTVVGNLVDNALDACDAADPWVEVTVRQGDSALCLSVADSGPGMDADDLAQARQRGYSTKPSGTEGRRGLGLALVSQVVQRHGGELTAEATYGSVVSVRIPRERT